MTEHLMRLIKDIRDEPAPTKEGEKVYEELRGGWIGIYTAEDGKWVGPYRCYPAVMD